MQSGKQHASHTIHSKMFPASSLLKVSSRGTETPDTPHHSAETLAVVLCQDFKNVALILHKTRVNTDGIITQKLYGAAWADLPWDIIPPSQC